MKKPQQNFAAIGKDYTAATVERMCFTKRAWDTKNAARDAGSKYDQHAYKCPICKRWHLTSLSNEDGNAARRRAKL